MGTVVSSSKPEKEQEEGPAVCRGEGHVPRPRPFSILCPPPPPRALLTKGVGPPGGWSRGVACSTWVTSEKLADTQALRPPLAFPWVSADPVHLRRLPETSVRSGGETPSRLLDGETLGQIVSRTRLGFT